MDEVKVFNVEGYFDSGLSQRFAEFCATLTTPEIVVLEIESVGGEVQCLKEMTDAILALKEQGFVFVTSVKEYAYSCGFLLLMLGDILDVTDTARVLYHPVGLEIEDRITADDAREILNILAEADDFANQLLLSNTNITPENFAFIKKNEVFMDRKDLIHLGLMEENYNY